MHAPARHASAGPPKRPEPARHASAGVPKMHELAVVVDAPRPTAGRPTEPAPNPTGQPPHPPPRYFHVIGVRIAFERRRQARELRAEPDMPRVEVRLVHRPVRPARHAVRIGL